MSRLLILVLALLGAEICYSHSTTITAPSSWFGTAPVCNHDYTCNDFDMNEMETSSYGDGAYCFTGSKVLCQARPVGIKAMPKEKGLTLRLMTYNIFQRPYVTSHDGQVERTCKIPRILGEDYSTLDLVVFEEAHLGGCNWQMTFKTLLPYYGWPFYTDILREYDTVNGGVEVFSKYQLNGLEYNVFTNYDMLSSDALTPKGFIYGWFEKMSTKIHFIATHLQSANGHRAEEAQYGQAKEIGDFVRSKNIPKNDVLVVLGDMSVDNNSAPEKVKKLFAEMNVFPLEKTSGPNLTLDPATDDVVEPGKEAGWYDYIGYGLETRKPKKTTLMAVNLKSNETVSYCTSAPMAPYYVHKDGIMCRDSKETKDLSDHYPVIATLRF